MKNSTASDAAAYEPARQQATISDDGETGEEPLFRGAQVREKERLVSSSSRDEKKLPEAGTVSTARSSTSSSLSCSSSSIQQVMDEEKRRMLLRMERLLRAEQEAKLKQFYEQSRSGRLPGVVLISGPSGSGKVRLARTVLYDETQGSSSELTTFLTGKFSPPSVGQPAPFEAFTTALDEYVNLVVQNQQRVEELKQAILENFTTSGQECDVQMSVLTENVPSLARILGCDDAQQGTIKHWAAATSSSMRLRFSYVFRLLLKAISSLGQCVLLLESIHYADCCSLDLLDDIAADMKNSGVFLIATHHRESAAETTATSSWATKLRDIADRGHVQINTLSLENLDNESHVQHTLSEALYVDLGDCAAIAKTVYDHTHGNLFHMRELLSRLYDQGYLVYRRDIGVWRWGDEEKVKRAIPSCSVQGFLYNTLKEQMSPEMIDLLKVAACLGSAIDEQAVEKILGYSIADKVRGAREKGIFVYCEKSCKDVFVHDIVRETVYNLIPQADRELFHVEIGRRLWRKLDEQDVERYAFLVLSQLSMGSRLISKEKERIAVARLCLHAGKKAAWMSSFQNADFYLSLGLQLLSSEVDCWQKEYDLSLALHNAAAEIQVRAGNFERMEELAQTVHRHAKSFDDKFQTYITNIHALGILGKHQECLDLGMEVLKELGEHFPRRYGRLFVLSQWKKVKKSLWGKSDEQLLRLPEMQNKKKLKALQVLQLLMLPSIFSRPDIARMVLIRMIRLTLEYGLSVLAPAGFIAYGMFCVAIKNIDEATRFGDLALTLLKRNQVVEWLPRVYVGVYGFIYGWKVSFSDVLEHMLVARRVGVATGDQEYANLAANFYCVCAIESGHNLSDTLKHYDTFYEEIVSFRQESLSRIAGAYGEYVRRLIGTEGHHMDFEVAEKIAIESGSTKAVIAIRLCRMRLAYIFNDYEEAARNLDLLVEARHEVAPSYGIMSVFFVSGLVALSRARTRRNDRKSLQRARFFLRQLRKWCKTSPLPCAGKALLLEAELASVRRNKKLAFEKYTIAILVAKGMENPCEEGLCNECAGRHFLALGDTFTALPYLRAARDCFHLWGAKAKVLLLENEIDSLLS